MAFGIACNVGFHQTLWVLFDLFSDTQHIIDLIVKSGVEERIVCEIGEGDILTTAAGP